MRANLLFSTLTMAAIGVAEAAERPNVIFILADDMGYGDVSFFDEESKMSSENLNKMAREGVYFTDAHSCSSVSSPTRYGVLTGRYSWRSSLTTGVLNGYSSPMIAPDRSTMATMLKKMGYTTGFVGKWNMGWDWVTTDGKAPHFDAKTMEMDNVDYSQKVRNGATTRGFDYSFGFCGSLDLPPYVYIENDMPTTTSVRLTDRSSKEGREDVTWRMGPTGADFDHWETLPHLIDKASGFIDRSAKGDDPFFLYIPLPAPHAPIMPTEEFEGQSGLGRYGDFVFMVDAMVGRIFSAIEAAGVDDNTIVIFSTNNGCSPTANFEALLEQGHRPNSIYRGYKADLYEGGHRVPTMIHWGDRLKPHEVSQTVCSIDFYATIADIVGYELQDGEAEDSYSLLPAIKGRRDVKPIREATVHHSLFGEFAIRQGDWKLLLSKSSGGWSDPRPQAVAERDDLPRVQLYNIESDPAESENLYEKYPERVEAMTKLLIKYVEEGRSTPGAPQKNEVAEWDQLDYFIK